MIRTNDVRARRATTERSHVGDEVLYILYIDAYAEIIKKGTIRVHALVQFSQIMHLAISYTQAQFAC